MKLEILAKSLADKYVKGRTFPVLRRDGFDVSTKERRVEYYKSNEGERLIVLYQGWGLQISTNPVSCMPLPFQQDHVLLQSASYTGFREALRNSVERNIEGKGFSAFIRKESSEYLADIICDLMRAVAQNIDARANVSFYGVQGPQRPA